MKSSPQNGRATVAGVTLAAFAASALALLFASGPAALTNAGPVPVEVSPTTHQVVSPTNFWSANASNIPTSASTPYATNAGHATSADTAAALTGTITSSQVSGLGSAATASTNAFDTNGAAAAVRAGALQSTNNLSDVASAIMSAANLGLPTLLGPTNATLICDGTSFTQGIGGITAGAPQNYPAVIQAGPWAAAGSLVFDLGFSQATTGQILGGYSGASGYGAFTILASGSGTVTFSAGQAASITPYMTATGSGIPAGTYVTSVSSSSGTLTSAVLNNAATSTGTITATFGAPFTGTLVTTGSSTTATYSSAGGPASTMGIAAASLTPDTYITAVTSGTTLTLSRPATATGTYTCAGGFQIINPNPPYTPYPGGAANGWSNFHWTAHMLSYAITGRPTFFAPECGNNDYLENTGAAFTVTGSTTSGSPVISIPSGYSTIAHGNILTGAGLPSGNQALWVVTGAGTNSVTLSGNATATGTVTLTVHVPTTQVDSWTSSYQSLIAAAHADGDTVANGGGVIAQAMTPVGNASRTGISDAFRSEFNAIIAGGTLGNDYTFNYNALLPTEAQLNAVGGFPYCWPADDVHLSAFGAALNGQQFGQFLLTLTHTTNFGGMARVGIGSTVAPSQTIYVSGNRGSDTRINADPHDPNYPFQTLAGALAAAQSGDTIIVTDGTIGGSLTWPNGVYAFLLPGVSGGIAITDNGAPVTGGIAGCGQMLTTFAVPITLTGTGSSFLANNLNFTSGSYDIDLHGTNEVVNVNGNLTGGVGSSAAAVQVEPGTANCAVTINGSATCLNTGNYDGTLDVYGSANAVTVNGPVYANGTQSAGYGVYTNGSNLKIAVRGDVQWLGTNSATGCSAVRTDGATNSVYITGTVSSANTNAPTIGNTVASSSTLTMGGLVEVPNHPSSMGTNIFVATPVQGTVSVNGSSSGTAVFSEPWRGAARKEVVIQLANLNGTASWTYSMPFGATPVVVNSDAAVTSVSATSVTVTGSGTSRTILLEGN